MKSSFSKRFGKIVFASAVLTMALAAIGGSIVRADDIPSGWTASNLKPIGYTDLDGRGAGAFKMAIKNVNGRWILYLSHLWDRGWSIADVTDPANPKFVKFVPYPEQNTRTINIDLHDNLMVTSLGAITLGWGGDPNKPHDEGLLFWDISDPVNPKQLAHWKTGSSGTHRNGYPGGKYANAAANMPGFRGQILVFLDVTDPKNPKEVSRWWMHGQKEGEEPARTDISFHGPAVVTEDGKTAYLGYGPAAVILDISDITKPKEIGRLNLAPPFKPGGTAVHGVIPIPGKNLLFANSEAGNEKCDEPLSHATMVDIKDPTKPRLMSVFPLPEPPKGLPYTHFCDKGGRFGPHNFNMEYHLPDVQKQGDLVYLTYFNAGLRVFDIKDPRAPREVAWFIPPTPPKRRGPIPTTALVNQTEDVLVDTRGNIYITDKQWGVFILRLAPM